MLALHNLFDEMTQKSTFGFDLFYFPQTEHEHESESRGGNVPAANKRRSKQEQRKSFDSVRQHNSRSHDS